jgi:uncharacterized protein YjbI with pentapeptide repeats
MQGVKVWNEWRREHKGVRPELAGADIHGGDLRDINLREANLGEANLSGTRFDGADLVNADLGSADLTLADLRGAILRGANLCEARLGEAYLGGATLCDADLSGAHLTDANLGGANLARADLTGADITGGYLDGANLGGARLNGAHLEGARLVGAYLDGANLSGAELGGAMVNEARVVGTIFADLDLREVEGLESLNHWGPSEVSISTIYRSEGRIPEGFLRNCGVPDDFITFLPSLTTKAIEFYSCFISYSGKDEEFARRLHSRMREAELRVWFAPEDVKGGDKLYDQIDRAIQVHDRLLLVLSKSSMKSKWVETEIRRARKVELKEGRRKLFPIRLVGYEALQQWACIDSTTGEDLAEEVRSYFIPDFSNWKNHDDFELAFARLLTDLKASA